MRHQRNNDRIFEIRINKRNIKATTLRDKDTGILPVGNV